MDTELFFSQSPSLFSIPEVRRLALERQKSNSLIRRICDGDRMAAEALHIGFWPFVREFELAIDKHHLPRDPLTRRFAGDDPAKVRRVFRALAESLTEMREEEGSHAMHWKKDASCLGIDLDTHPDAQKPIGRVKDLIDASYDPHLPTFFGVLAGTEFIAEEMSALLLGVPGFVNMFSRKRWMWGEVHVEEHQGPSHLEIDIDLGRAYSDDDELARRTLLGSISRTVDLFDQASIDVEAALAPVLRH